MSQKQVAEAKVLQQEEVTAIHNSAIGETICRLFVAAAEAKRGKELEWETLDDNAKGMREDDPKCIESEAVADEAVVVAQQTHTAAEVAPDRSLDYPQETGETFQTDERETLDDNAKGMREDDPNRIESEAVANEAVVAHQRTPTAAEVKCDIFDYQETGRHF
jgi:hypothetical protein